jgi:hypothetical protein
MVSISKSRTGCALQDPDIARPEGRKFILVNNPYSFYAHLRNTDTHRKAQVAG